MLIWCALENNAQVWKNHVWWMPRDTHEPEVLYEGLMFAEDEIKLVRVFKQSLSRNILIQNWRKLLPFTYVCLDYIITFAYYIFFPCSSLRVSMAYYRWLLMFLAGFSLFAIRVCPQGKLIELRKMHVLSFEYILSKRPSWSTCTS